MRHVIIHESKGDGHLAWYEFLSEYDSDIYKEQRITEFRAILDTPYTKNFPGGIPAYLSTIEKAYTDLDCIDPTCMFHTRTPDGHKVNLLKDKFATTPRYNDQIYREYQNWTRDTKGNFKSFIQQIKSWYAFQNQSSENIRRALQVTSTSTNAEIPTTDDPSDIRRANYGERTPYSGTQYPPRQQPPRNPMYIPREAIQVNSNINKDLNTLIFALRQNKIDHDKAKEEGREAESLIILPEPAQLFKLLKEMKRSLTQQTALSAVNPVTTTTTTQTLPSQYGSTRGNLGTTQETTYQVVDTTQIANLEEALTDYAAIQAYTPTDESDSDSDARSGNMVRTYRIHTDYDRYVHGNIAQKGDQYVSIVDGGADSMILGAGWLFDNLHPSKKVNIFGFYETHANKR